MRFLLAILAAATLILAAFTSAPYRATQAQAAPRSAEPMRKFAVDWGAWPELSVRMSEQHLLSIIRRRTDTSPVAVPLKPGDPNKAYILEYTVDGSRAVEEIRVNKVTRTLSSVKVRLSPAAPCEKVMDAISDVLNEPRMLSSGPISFNGTGSGDTATWRDKGTNQHVFVSLKRLEKPRTCDRIEMLAL